MQPKLGILAGGGRLPADIVDICQRTGRSFHVIAFEGQVDDGLCDNIPIPVFAWAQQAEL